jgi:hypothetical protein
LQWTLKAKTITIDEVTLPVIVSTVRKNASTLHVQRLNDILAMEPLRTQDANKRANQMLDKKAKKADLQSIIKGNCKHLSANHQKGYCSFSLNMSCFSMAPQVTGKLSRSPFNQAKEENNYTRAELSQC